MIIIKTIGIIIREQKKNNLDYLGVKKDLFDTLKKFNVCTIGIPITNNFKELIQAVNLCDGIILSGGSKVLENDIKLVKYLYEQNIPTLGICLGMQTMCFAYNNKQEIKVQNHCSLEEYVHFINIQKNTLLYKIIGTERIKVNSRHNYAINITNFKINAISDDSIIEGIEDDTKKFFLGLEWHPESLEDENSYKIFNYFIKML